MSALTSTGAAIAPELEQTLAASRARPLPAAPAGAAEPDMARHQSWRWAAAVAGAVGAVGSAGSSRGEAAEVEAGTGGAYPGAGGVPLEPEMLHELGVAQLLAAFAHGSTTPSAVMAVVQQRLVDPALSPDAVLALIDGAVEAAAESDARWRAGTARALEGVPFGVKDIIDVASTLVTCGSLQTGDRIATEDATVVARLRAAGAIPVAMLATTEFACGDPKNARYGAVTNPWHRDHWTGGSSTGSGAALASRMVPLALGTDTGGSIRIPSALCGVSGLKPSYGMVPRTGVASLSWTMDHVGPMARSAADLRLVMEVLAGPDGVDPSVPDLAIPLAPRVPVNALRIGVPLAWFCERVDAGVLANYAATLAGLEAAGVELVEVDFAGLEQIHEESWLVFYSELASNQEGNRGRADLFDAGTRSRLECGFVPSGADYLRALRRRVEVQQMFRTVMDEAGVDAFVTPGPGAVAPTLTDMQMYVDGTSFNMHQVIPRNTRMFDYTGMPALMVPSGLAGGLPTGIQVVGRLWDDAIVLDIGHAIQQATSHHLMDPHRR